MFFHQKLHKLSYLLTSFLLFLVAQAAYQISTIQIGGQHAKHDRMLSDSQHRWQMSVNWLPYCSSLPDRSIALE